ncbi:MAG: hypothetical protein ACF8R7_10505 [Phycisphaerales bacterium JB039]
MTAPRSARAFAKLNLALAVAPPEPPESARAGWHRIASWMVPIALHDDVTVEPLARGAAGRLDIRWADDAPLRAGQGVDWPAAADLAARARAALEAEVDRQLPSDITIRKRICAGAGLGGGSADAAAVLQLLDVAFDLGLGPARLRQIGAHLGSDIPFFIDDDLRASPRAALVTDFGEVAQRWPAPEAACVLVIPHFQCATAEVYRAFDRLAPGPLRAQEITEMVIAGSAALAGGGARLFNDLAGAAESIEPRLASLRAAIGAEAGLPAHVTGSGSAMFVLPPADEARPLAERLARIASPGVALATTTVSDSMGVA